NFRVALLAMGLAAVSFWMVSTNRVGLRANSLPLVTLPVLIGLWRVCFHQPESSGRRWKTALVTGVILGFAIYTYTASIALYAAFALFIVSLFFLDRDILKHRLPELTLISLLAAVLTLPMLNYRLNDPVGSTRVSTINAPYTQLREGSPDAVLENARLLLGMPIINGDPEWRYNVAERALFLLPVGVMVYAGFGILLWRSRQKPIYTLLLGLAIFGLVPSLLTTSAPSFLRSIITLPSLMIFMAVSLDGIGEIRKRWSHAAWGIGILVIVVTAAVDWHAYFGTWINNDHVQAVYRDDLEQLAGYLHQSDERIVFVTTPDPAVLDSTIYKYYMNPQQDTDIVWFDGFATIVLRDEPTLLFVSPRSPILFKNAEWLMPEMGTRQLRPVLRQDGDIAFDVYEISAEGNAVQERLAHVSTWQVYIAPEGKPEFDDITDRGVPLNYPVNLGDVLQLVGVEMPRTSIPSQDIEPGSGLNLWLYLQPLISDYGDSLSLFVHILTPDDEMVKGRDFLGAPPTSWNPDMIFIQDNYIGEYNLEPGRYYVVMGLYDTVTGARFPILDESGNILGDRLFIGQIEVVGE
ncbi:MAG TPA: hypothetical protein VJZ27_08440, partial [Aggregatilineales bacterium]|nr:hypothetical protein [Aggregatilineales bacterium]